VGLRGGLSAVDDGLYRRVSTQTEAEAVRDYLYEDERGQMTPVEKMSTSDIEDILRTGFRSDGTTPPAAVTERLRLELFIREKGLRT
jgi:hypothetical protein